MGWGTAQRVVGRRRPSDESEWHWAWSAAALCSAVAVLVAALLTGRAWELPAARLYEIRESLHMLGGVLFFGAGLLQLSIWTVRRDSYRDHLGVALMAFGFLAPGATALGPALHDGAVAAVLSPWTAAATAVVTLLAARVGTRVDVLVRRPRAAAMVAAAGCVLVLCVPRLAEQGLPVWLDLPAPLHVALELAVAATWMILAVRLARTPEQSPVLHRAAAPLAVSMAVAWGFRAVAVLDLQPWSVAPAAVIAATGVVLLCSTALAFARTTDAQQAHVAEVQGTLESVAEAYVALDEQRRALRHDARNVIFALRGASDMLVRHGTDLDPRTREQLRAAMADELERLAELIDGQHAGAEPAAPAGGRMVVPIQPAVRGTGRIPGRSRDAVLPEVRAS